MTDPTEVYEKLGAFYLGRDDEEAPLLYDSRDLLTHAVCVGMTGSGKTGLCIGLLEEAAIDGVPAIVVDPKGDLGNLLLTFPDLAPSDFEPWVSPEDAHRKGITTAALAEAEAKKWREGLASWDQSPERIQRLRDAAEFTIFTPGSDAGEQLSIIKSFDAPGPQIRQERDLFQERIETAVTSLLGLIGVDADPIQSREHVLLSTILSEAWTRGVNVDLTALITLVQRPPFERVGVMDLEVFYPESERFKLSMQLNNLVASPSFASWSSGRPLNVQDLLYTQDGRPRIAILSIAHLSDQERMFFVSLLFNEVLGWVRTQPGSTNLRALLYMDEMHGFIPPVANPPSKRPLLSLMKQARAFGLGVVLATQNPVDLDYKALSNAGTWFIGRLQTAQDKARLLDALHGASDSASGSFDRDVVGDLISGLGKRRFLLHNVHEGAPLVFQTRWVMSYLRGPLVRDEIRALTPDRRAPEAGADEAAQPPAPPTEAPSAPSPTAAPTAPAASAPDLPARVEQRYVRVDPTMVVTDASLVYQPAVFGTAAVTFHHAKSGLVRERRAARIATFTDAGELRAWPDALPTHADPERFDTSPDPGVTFASLPSVATKSTSFTTWKNGFADFAYDNERETVLYSAALDEFARPSEDERAFRIRLSALARERRDDQADDLRRRYASRVDRIDERIRTAERRVDREKAQARRASVDAGTRAGVAVFDAIFGRRRSVARGTASSIRAGARAREQRADVAEAEARLDELESERTALLAELEAETQRVGTRTDPRNEQFQRVEVAPRRRDVSDASAILLWLPLAVTSDGARLAFQMD